MSSIIFLDVEVADQALVTAHCPDAIFLPGSPGEKDLVKLCANAEVISTFITTAFPREVIEQLPKLRLLCTRSVGTDHIDTAACAERGIVVCNVPDYGSHVIAEHVFALLLSTLRHIHLGHERVTQGQFDYHGLRGIALKGKTIGIVGTGRIGRQVARIAHGFDMTILATDQCRTTQLEKELSVHYVPLDGLLTQSDIVTLHLPATPETEHLFDAATLGRMRKGSILVNTARGSLIDSHALLDAIKTGQLSYALLDVLEHEQNFEENKELIEHAHVVTTPHIAFYADDSMRNMFLDTLQSITEWKRGKQPEHRVRPFNVVCDLQPIRESRSR